MVRQTARIAIIGGGMGGMTAAIALKKIAGVQATVFEQASKLGEVGAGVTRFQPGDRVMADAKDGEIVLEVKEREAPAPEPEPAATA